MLLLLFLKHPVEVQIVDVDAAVHRVEIHHNRAGAHAFWRLATGALVDPCFAVRTDLQVN